MYYNLALRAQYRSLHPGACYEQYELRIRSTYSSIVWPMLHICSEVLHGPVPAI